LQQRKGSIPELSKAGIHAYSPKVEASINHYFSFNERRHLDLNKVKLVMDEYKAEAQ
jgi:hypothetical protein